MEEDDLISSHRKAKADTEKRESDQLIKVPSCQAKRAVVPKRLIQLLVRCWLPNILRTFSQNKLIVGRNEIHRSYPIFGLPLLPWITGYYNSLNGSTIVAL